MARSHTPPGIVFRDVVARAITPPLKGVEFRKSGMNYHRRRGEVVQVVNIQLSRGSSATEKEFFINVGLSFDSICRLAGVPILENPNEAECSDRGTRGRLEQLMANAPTSWAIHAEEDVSRVAASLQNVMEGLTIELDRIDGLAAYRSHRWFDRFRPVKENAQVLYLLGDTMGAWQEVEALAALFADRRNANRSDWWIEQLRLTGLTSAIDSHETR